MSGVKKAKTAKGTTNDKRNNRKAYAKNTDPKTYTVAGPQKYSESKPVLRDYLDAVKEIHLGRTFTTSY